MTIGQGLAVLFVVVVAWVRPDPASVRQLDAFVVSIAILMVFANQARRRMALSAAVLVGTDVILSVRSPASEANVVPVLLDHTAGWLFGVLCSVTLNASRRRSYLHWSAERAARDSLDEEAARRREAERELTRLAERDDLTDLPNRRVFLARADEALAASRELARPLCGLVLDADHFKRINDEWGHQVGDEVLRHLTAGLRELDRSGHIVGRLGGEEFGIVVLSGEARAMDLADRLRRRVAGDWFFVGTEVLQLTMSIGVAMAGPDDSVADVLRRADEALYVAKREGRDQVRVAG
jgi:diguanylate cyclase